MNSTTGPQTGFNNPTSLARSLIIALAVNWGLQGMLCLQVYTYYLAFPAKDPLYLVIQVYGVFVWELVQTAVVAHDVIAALAPGSGDPQAALNSLLTYWFSIPVCGGITGGVGQLFFAYRIWSLSGQLKPTLAIAFLSFASVCSAMFSAGAFFAAKTFSNLLAGNLGFASIAVWNGIGAICDLSIALSMPYFLMRRGTGLKSTHVMLVRLVRLLIEIGGLTAIMAILHLCLYSSHNELFVIPGLSMSKIYAITMLVILNNRLRIEGGRFDQAEEEVTFSPSSDTRRRSRTNIIVSNGRLTFQLADVVPARRNGETSTDHDRDSVVDMSAVKDEVDDLEHQ